MQRLFPAHLPARLIGLALLAGRVANADPAPAAAPASAACIPPTVGKSVPFGVGEKIEMEIDALGAMIGTFSMTTAPGHRPDVYTIVARGRTDQFAGSFYPVEAIAHSQLGAGLDDRGYDEDATEDGVQRSVAVEFPPKGPELRVQASKQGDSENYAVSAPPETRDMLGALYQLRTLALADGASFCVPIFGGRRIWVLRGTVVGREPVQTPLGEYKAIHLSATASRLDAPRVSRELHLWITDDAERIPVAAFGILQGKPVRAQLVKYARGRMPARR